MGERWHPLREEWVIVAAHRQSRPWSGAEVAAQAPSPPAFDPACYLCPGNARVSGAENPAYTGTFVFDNDHPCVGADAPRDLRAAVGIYRNRPATGIARVVCYSPRHDITLAELDVDGVDALLATWQEQMRELAAHPEVAFVLIFENKGEAVGVTNPHPHCQIYATNFIFKTSRPSCRPAGGISRRPATRLFQDIIAAERRTDAGSSASTAARSRSCRTSRAMRTRSTWRRCAAYATIADLDDDERGISHGAPRRGDPLRQPVADAVPVRDGAASGAGDGGRDRLPLPHRVPSAAAPAEPAEVPRGSRDRRRQFPQRHVARREGGRARRRRRAALRRIGRAGA